MALFKISCNLTQKIFLLKFYNEIDSNNDIPFSWKGVAVAEKYFFSNKSEWVSANHLQAEEAIWLTLTHSLELQDIKEKKTLVP